MIGGFQISVDIKILYISHYNVLGFYLLSLFLDLHKEQEKDRKSAIFFVTSFLSIKPFTSTFQEAFVKNRCFKTTLRHVLRHA